MLDEKMRTSRKPIFPVLPSTLTAGEEVTEFLRKGRINFPDEVILGKALAKVYTNPKPSLRVGREFSINEEAIRKIILRAKTGYLSPAEIQGLLDAAGIPRAKEAVARTREEAILGAKHVGYPLVMKVVGPVHKSDVGGVALNIADEVSMLVEFQRMLRIQGTTGILLQPMLAGTEIFIGAKFEPKFGHMILCGLGGIFIEVLKDVKSALAPLSMIEAREMINGLKGRQILDGVRGRNGIDKEKFAEAIVRTSQLVRTAKVIVEMDLNPLLGTPEGIVAVDARIRINKE
jgi:acetyltransferase